MTDLTANQQAFLASIREQESPTTWLLFVNAGYTLDDARELRARGLIETSMQMGLPAARLPLPVQVWAVFDQGELRYIGKHDDEEDCWRVALGWPDEEEIAGAKKRGMTCKPVAISSINPST